MKLYKLRWMPPWQKRIVKNLVYLSPEARIMYIPHIRKVKERIMTDIKGYVPLTEVQKLAVNYLKDQEHELLTHLRTLKDDENVNIRWLSMARTHIEQAFMFATRAITNPITVEWP